MKGKLIIGVFLFILSGCTDDTPLEKALETIYYAHPGVELCLDVKAPVISAPDRTICVRRVK